MLDKLVTDTVPHRALIFDGANGCHVLCNVYGKRRASTLYRFNDEWKLESATSSLVRMKNLLVCRGDGGASRVMFGPCDYFGALESIANKVYRIEVRDRVMMVYECSGDHRGNDDDEGDGRAGDKKKASPPSAADDDDDEHGGEDGKHGGPSAAAALACEMTGNWRGFCLEKNSAHSLFQKPGLLAFDTRQTVFLLDDHASAGPAALAAFGARLVRNGARLRFLDGGAGAHHWREARDDLRVISYRFGPGYAAYQFRRGDGLFLERHRFIQAITPLERDAGGFVMLARRGAGNGDDRFALIAVRIPFGSTLILREDCLHGDATLSGYYAMCMTSDHESMKTADTVFLKNANGENVMFVMGDGDEEKEQGEAPKKGGRNLCAPTNAIYNYSEGAKAIFNPFSRGYWKVVLGAT